MAEEQNYWPGFVDALSNVVLTLLFVLVVFILALVIVSNKVEEKAMEMVEKVKQEHVAHEEVIDLKEKNKQLMKQLQEAEDEKEELEKKLRSASDKEVLERHIVNAKEGGELKSNFIVMMLKEDRIILEYPKDISALDDEAAEEFMQVLEKVRKALGTKGLKLNSHVGSEAYTSAHRLAYYRALSVRNRLLIGKYNTKAEIKTRIIENKNEELGRVEIIFK